MIRSIRSLLIFSSIIITAPACTKWFYHPEDRLEGSWRVTSVERKSFLTWKSVANDYENGVFTFFANGDAYYEDSFGTAEGIWEMRTVSDDYVDGDGIRHNNSRNTLSVSLHNFPDNFIIQLDFDYFRFKGKNRILADYHTPSYVYRYEFRRN